MPALKAHEVDRELERAKTAGDLKYNLFLVYGPDTGLVCERADRLAAISGVDLADPFCFIRLDADESASDRARLVDEALTVSMFGGKRLIRVSGSTRKNLAEAVKPLLEQTLKDAIIIIEAGELDRRSALRTLFEKSKTGLALPCYPDNDRDLERLIEEELAKDGLTIDRQTMAYLKLFLGADRKASRNELAKLALYAIGERNDGAAQKNNKVTLDDIRAIVGDASAIGAEDLVDAVMCGNLGAYNDHFMRLREEAASPDRVLIMALRQFQLLHELVSSGKSGSDAVKSARPPIHFARHAAFMAALKKWRSERLFLATRRLYHAIYEARAKGSGMGGGASGGDLAWAVAGTSLLALTIEAARSR